MLSRLITETHTFFGSTAMLMIYKSEAPHDQMTMRCFYLFIIVDAFTLSTLVESNFGRNVGLSPDYIPFPPRGNWNPECEWDGLPD